MRTIKIISCILWLVIMGLCAVMFVCALIKGRFIMLDILGMSLVFTNFLLWGSELYKLLRKNTITIKYHIKIEL